MVLFPSEPAAFLYKLWVDLNVCFARVCMLTSSLLSDIQVDPNSFQVKPKDTMGRKEILNLSLRY